MLKIPKNGEGASKGPLQIHSQKPLLIGVRAGCWDSHPPKGVHAVKSTQKPSSPQSSHRKNPSRPEGVKKALAVLSASHSDRPPAPSTWGLFHALLREN